MAEVRAVQARNVLRRDERDGHEGITHPLGSQHSEREVSDARLRERRTNPVSGDVDDETHDEDVTTWLARRPLPDCPVRGWAVALRSREPPASRTPP